MGKDVSRRRFLEGLAISGVAGAGFWGGSGRIAEGAVMAASPSSAPGQKSVGDSTPNSGGSQNDKHHEWTFSVNAEKQAFCFSHSLLGVVAENIQFNRAEGSQLVRLSGWTVQEEGPDEVVITTEKPVPVRWGFKASRNRIEVQSSAAHGVITGSVLAPESRILARLVDPARVQTVLTPIRADYTGTPFHEKFYIPSEAGNVMYLSLGFVDALSLNALFDRPRNIAIQFQPDGRMSRNKEKPSNMDFVFPVKGDTTFLTLMPEYYTKVLGNPRYVPYDDFYHKTAPTGWNHWLAFFTEVTEQDIVNAADWVEANLKAYGMEHIQLDDGYQHPDHRLWVKGWIKKKFPHGPRWLASYIKSKGLIPGWWSVPFCYEVQAGKPDWFLRDKSGKVVMDADYVGGGEIDFTRPEAIHDYWVPILEEMKSQGWEYLKFDMGKTIPTWKNYSDKFYDRTQTPYDVAFNTIKIFRDIMGPELWFTDHPDDWGARVGYVDVVGCGQDPGPGWRQLNHFLRVISNNTYQNHIIWYSDPDCMVLRGKPTRADPAQGNHEFCTLEEARTAASLLSLAGLQLLSGDDLPNLEPERVELIKKTIPILPIFPIDLFGRSRDYERYPEIFDLKVNQPSGIYDVISVTNWTEAPTRRTVSFSKELGLSANERYLVFDFWNEHLAGVFGNDFAIDLPMHGTRVFTIRRAMNRPQLLATNRHITGAFSILKQSWDSASRTLSGTSKTVPRARYALFLHVPDGVSVRSVHATVQNVDHNQESNGLLRISFLGEETPVEWKVTFTRSHPS